MTEIREESEDHEMDVVRGVECREGRAKAGTRGPANKGGRDMSAVAVEVGAKADKGS